MKTYAHFRQYLSELLEGEMFLLHPAIFVSLSHHLFSAMV